MASTIEGSEALAKNIVKYTNGFLRELNVDMDKARDIMHKEVKKNISLRDHSLKDLARMGHPYSKRNPKVIHQPPWQVHEQSGELVRGLFSTTEPAEVIGGRLSAAAVVGIKDNVEHARHIIWGTSKMIPRDFLNGSVESVKHKIFDTLRRSLKNATVSFRGEKVKL